MSKPKMIVESSAWTICNVEMKNLINNLLSYQTSYWKTVRFGKKKKITYTKFLIEKSGAFAHDENSDMFYFLSGFVPRVQKFLKEKGIDYDFESKVRVVEYDDPEIEGVDFRYYQKNQIEAALETGRGVVKSATGTGKCHGRDTKIIMYDGSIKNVQDIKIKDKVMGPDSKPRTVLSTTIGNGPLYKITPIKGESFTCNENHILSLQYTTCRKYKNGEIINISVKDYLKENKNFKHLTKLYRTGINFKKQNVEFDPYMAGLYLGDGTKSHSGITTNKDDIEVIQYVKDFCKKNNFKLVIDHYENRHCITQHIRKPKNKGVGTKYSPFIKFIKTLLTKNNERKIPQKYLINSKKNRLQLLAGLVDSDGFVDNNNIQIVCKDYCFSEQILFLARSLGFMANCSKVTKGIKSLNFKGEYYSVNISGDTYKIPTKVKRKKCTKRKQKKNPLRTGFKIKQIENGTYYGFQLNKDHLYLLKDFTVTHNSYSVMGIINAFSQEKILFLVDASEILKQLKEDILKVVDHFEVSDYREKRGFKRIHVSTVQTFKNQVQKHKDYFDVVIIDEVDKVSSFSGMFAKVLMALTAPVKLGVTATIAQDKPETQWALEGLIGPVISEYTIHQAGEDEVLSKPILHIEKSDKIPASQLLDSTKLKERQKEIYEEKLKKWRKNKKGPAPKQLLPKKYNIVYQNAITVNIARNNTIATIAENIMYQGGSTLISVVKTEHGKILESMICGAKFIYGGTPEEERNKIKSDFESGKLKCVIASVVWQRGISVHRIAAYIKAEGGKSETAGIQWVGRALRRDQGNKTINYEGKVIKSGQVLFCDFDDSAMHHYLKKHTQIRMQLYKNQGWVV